MRAYCFGNEFLEYDSLAKRLVDHIDSKIEIIKADDPSEIFLEEKTIVIIDVVKGIDDIVVFDDISKLRESRISSMHDFDLGYFLKLMKSIDQIGRVVIIGIPMKGDEDSLRKKLRETLDEIDRY